MHVCHVVYTSVVNVFCKFNTSIVHLFSTGKYKILRVHYLSVGGGGGGGWFNNGRGIYFTSVKEWFINLLKKCLGRQ